MAFRSICPKRLSFQAQQALPEAGVSYYSGAFSVLLCDTVTDSTPWVTVPGCEGGHHTSSLCHRDGGRQGGEREEGTETHPHRQPGQPCLPSLGPWGSHLHSSPGEQAPGASFLPGLTWGQAWASQVPAGRGGGEARPWTQTAGAKAWALGAGGQLEEGKWGRKGHM